ncbi:MAG: lactate utilization protein [Oscillospiraceae bacterium]
MDNNLKFTIEKRIEKVGKALEKNNMVFYYAKDVSEAQNIVKSLLKDGETIANGGSMSLNECGIMDILRSGNYNFLDREKFEDKRELYLKSFYADSYLCSANAITENGELYNVDGNGNRVACLTYGPNQVIVVAGYNKIVKDLNSAIERVKKISAPANTLRLNCDTYCNHVGECVSNELGQGCNSDSRICCSYVVTSRQRFKNRIKVIIVGEVLGY